MSNTYMNKKINNDERKRDMVVGKVVGHLCLTLIIKELKFNVEHDMEGVGSMQGMRSSCNLLGNSHFA